MVHNTECSIRWSQFSTLNLVTFEYCHLVMSVCYHLVVFVYCRRVILLLLLLLPAVLLQNTQRVHIVSVRLADVVGSVVTKRVLAD